MRQMHEHVIQIIRAISAVFTFGLIKFGQFLNTIGNSHLFSVLYLHCLHLAVD
jgi:hypothetical protein